MKRELIEYWKGWNKEEEKYYINGLELDNFLKIKELYKILVKNNEGGRLNEFDK